jgi:hypothetical protein
MSTFATNFYKVMITRMKMRNSRKFYLLMMMVCFFCQGTQAQDTVTGIPNRWKVNGQEVRHGKLSGIADSSVVVLTPTTAEAGRIKTIKARGISPWRGQSVDLSVVTADHIGWVIATNGRVYPHVMAAKSEETIPVAMIAYLGNVSDCSHGLAIALNDASMERLVWSDASTAVSEWSSTYSVKDATWRLPTIQDLQVMGGDDNRLPQLITTSGGQRVLFNYYWTSTENENGTAGFYLFYNSSFQFGNKTHLYGVRAVLAF